MFIVEWWNALGFTAQVFYCIAIPATLVLLVQTLLMFIGIGNDAAGMDGPDVSEGIDAFPDDAPSDGVFGEDMVTEDYDGFGLEGLRIFTLRGIVAFFVVFGWVGVVMESGGARLWLTLLISTICGFAMMLVLAFLLRALMKLRSDGNTDNRNAVGTSGRVYLTIPPARSGEGKVQVMLQGSYVERNAVTDEKEPIPTGAEIVVVGVSGQTELVVRRK